MGGGGGWVWGNGCCPYFIVGGCGRMGDILTSSWVVEITHLFCCWGVIAGLWLAAADKDFNMWPARLNQSSLIFLRALQSAKIRVELLSDGFIPCFTRIEVVCKFCFQRGNAESEKVCCPLFLAHSFKNVAGGMVHYHPQLRPNYWPLSIKYALDIRPLSCDFCTHWGPISHLCQFGSGSFLRVEWRDVGCLPRDGSTNLSLWQTP